MRTIAPSWMPLSHSWVLFLRRQHLETWCGRGAFSSSLIPCPHWYEMAIIGAAPSTAFAHIIADIRSYRRKSLYPEWWWWSILGESEQLMNASIFFYISWLFVFLTPFSHHSVKDFVIYVCWCVSVYRMPFVTHKLIIGILRRKSKELVFIGSDLTHEYRGRNVYSSEYSPPR